MRGFCSLKKFKASFKYLTPMAATLTITLSLGLALKLRGFEAESLTIFPETFMGATLNTGVFIILMLVAASLMYTLVRYGLHKVVINIIRLTLMLAVVMLLLWFSQAYCGERLYYRLLTLFASLLIGGLLTYGVYRGGVASQIGCTAAISSLIGTFLGFSIPLFTSLILLLGLSIYDVVSVYKGPIGKMAERIDIGSFVGAVVNYGDLTIGMGDLVFYSMLVNTALVNLGLTSAVAASIGVLAGSYGALRILEKRNMFPGLPIPLLTGMALALIFDALHG